MIIMECPHCHQEIPGLACPECGAVVPAASRFCMECGATLNFESPEVAADDNDGFSLEDRILCPDGTCTGIIIDGKCIECGKKYPGKKK